jgi:hypothetical protein
MIFEPYSVMRFVPGSAFTYLPYLSAVSIENKVVVLWKNVWKNVNVRDDILHRKCKIVWRVQEVV